MESENSGRYQYRVWHAKRLNETCKKCDQAGMLGCLGGCEKSLQNFVITEDGQTDILLHSVKFQIKETQTLVIPRCWVCRNAFKYGCYDVDHPSKTKSAVLDTTIRRKEARILELVYSHRTDEKKLQPRGLEHEPFLYDLVPIVVEAKVDNKHEVGLGIMSTKDVPSSSSFSSFSSSSSSSLSSSSSSSSSSAQPTPLANVYPVCVEHFSPTDEIQCVPSAFLNEKLDSAIKVNPQAVQSLNIRRVDPSLHPLSVLRSQTYCKLVAAHDLFMQASLKLDENK